jgi:hypothetical protein
MQAAELRASVSGSLTAVDVRRLAGDERGRRGKATEW